MSADGDPVGMPGSATHELYHGLFTGASSGPPSAAAAGAGVMQALSPPTRVVRFDQGGRAGTSPAEGALVTQVRLPEPVRYDIHRMQQGTAALMGAGASL